MAFVFVKLSFGQDSLRQPKIESVSVYYSIIPFSSTYHLRNENTISVQTNFISNSKFSISAFAFYGTNQVRDKYNWHFENLQTSYIPPGDKIQSLYFSGSQVGLGITMYYRLIEKNKFFFSFGLNSSISFYTKAHAEYGTIYRDSLRNSTFIETNHTTDNYNSLKDKLPDIALINLVTKCQFPLTKRLTIFVEPFVSLIGCHKIYTHTLTNIGSNAGLTWKL